jgi:hypothetical protein
MEEEEIDGGHHDLDDGDEGCSEDRALLLHAPRHYQVSCSRPNDPLHAQFDRKVNQSQIFFARRNWCILNDCID